MKPRTVTPMRLQPYVSAILAICILLVLFARMIESSSLALQEFIKLGLVYDGICYMGSYLILCPSTSPPYATTLVVLAVFLSLTIWIVPGRSARQSMNN
jgi:hypothetical protein